MKNFGVAALLVAFVILLSCCVPKAENPDNSSCGEVEQLSDCYGKWVYHSTAYISPLSSFVPMDDGSENIIYKIEKTRFSLVAEGLSAEERADRGISDIIYDDIEWSISTVDDTAGIFLIFDGSDSPFEGARQIQRLMPLKDGACVGGCFYIADGRLLYAPSAENTLWMIYLSRSVSDSVFLNEDKTGAEYFEIIEAFPYTNGLIAHGTGRKLEKLQP